jgi:hypothetical protein
MRINWRLLLVLVLDLALWVAIIAVVRIAWEVFRG